MIRHMLHNGSLSSSMNHFHISGGIESISLIKYRITNQILDWPYAMANLSPILLDFCHSRRPVQYLIYNSTLDSPTGWIITYINISLILQYVVVHIVAFSSLKKKEKILMTFDLFPRTHDSIWPPVNNLPAVLDMTYYKNDGFNMSYPIWHTTSKGQLGIIEHNKIFVLHHTSSR